MPKRGQVALVSTYGNRDGTQRSKRRPAMQIKLINRENSTHCRRYLDFTCTGRRAVAARPRIEARRRPQRLLRRRFDARSRDAKSAASLSARQARCGPASSTPTVGRLGGARARVRRLSVSQRHRGRSVVQYRRSIRAAPGRRRRAPRRRPELRIEFGLRRARDAKLERRRVHELDVLPVARALRPRGLCAERDDRRCSARRRSTADSRRVARRREFRRRACATT